MTERVQVGGLQVAKVLFDFVNNEAIPGTGIAADQFWSGAEAVINDLAPKNRALLAKRDAIQAQIDAWHQARAGQAHDAAAYKAFLQEIGYLLPEPADFKITTENVDAAPGHAREDVDMAPPSSSQFRSEDWYLFFGGEIWGMNPR